MKILQLLKKFPLDFGQGECSHKTRGKRIAFSFVPRVVFDKKAKALDLGCGDGFWSRKLLVSGYVVASADIEKKYEPAIVVDADKKLPFSDRHFDLIWCSEVIEHLENPEFAANEMRRVLKVGGFLILTTPNSRCWVYRVLSLFGISPRKAQNPGHKQFFSLNDIKKLFPKAEVYGYFFGFHTRHFLNLLTPTFVIVEHKYIKTLI